MSGRRKGQKGEVVRIKPHWWSSTKSFVYMPIETAKALKKPKPGHLWPTPFGTTYFFERRKGKPDRRTKKRRA